jgi:hypothetical protein
VETVARWGEVYVLDARAVVALLQSEGVRLVHRQEAKMQSSVSAKYYVTNPPPLALDFGDLRAPPGLSAHQISGSPPGWLPCWMLGEVVRQLASPVALRIAAVTLDLPRLASTRRTGRRA